MSAFDRALILTGPTASGKTALALELAERIGAEIVALDSMTVYRGMDVGTAKPTRAERQRIPHHLIDVLDPWESLSVAWWLDRAAEACQSITARGKRPLFVGGTPFYLKALLYGLFPGPPGDERIRLKLEGEGQRVGAEALHARLAAVDPRTAARLHPNDLRRVVRALEVHELTGIPISQWQQTWDTPAFAPAPGTRPLPIPAAVLAPPREELYSRINARVERMLAGGWLEEVMRLRNLPRPLSREARQALGYRELIDHLDGIADLPSTMEQIRTRTRQFAKRQLTWFRHMPQLVEIRSGGGCTAQEVLRAWGESS